MKRAILFVAVASAAAGVVVVGLDRSGGNDNADGTTYRVSGALASQSGGGSTPTPLTAIERLERAIKLKSGTKKAVGEFELSTGQKVRLHTADIEDGQSCLIDEVPDAAAGASCLENGLFALRKVEFFVNSEGNPDQLEQLYVGGVVAPSIRSISVRKTDGSTAQLRLTRERAFLYESSAAELRGGVLPSELRLFGASGKLVEVLRIPPLEE